MLCTVSASAQITIGGHQPFYDMATKSMLFVASQASLSDLTATVDTVAGNKWTDIKIDGNAITGKIAFCFGNVSEDRTFVLSATEKDSSIVRFVRFTSLPVLHIVKENAFTNDYEKASLAFDSADTLMTGNCKIKHRGGGVQTQRAGINAITSSSWLTTTGTTSTARSWECARTIVGFLMPGRWTCLGCATTSPTTFGLTFPQSHIILTRRTR